MLGLGALVAEVSHATSYLSDNPATCFTGKSTEVPWLMDE